MIPEIIFTLVGLHLLYTVHRIHKKKQEAEREAMEDGPELESINDADLEAQIKWLEEKPRD